MGGTDSTDRVDDVGRGHLRDHGHHVDERDALAPHAGRHNLQYSTVQYTAGHEGAVGDLTLGEKK